ncbi:MAG TPA: hypothetical protein VJA94_25685 [Candidatus Angelobacter sp.]
MRKLLLPAALIVLLSAALAQQPDYNALLRRCSQHEKEALQHPQKFQFLERVEMDWGSETRAVIETTQGRADRIIAFHDQPLAPDQQKKQQQRLTRLLNDSKALRDEVADQREEAERRQLMVATLADAIVIEFEGTEPDGRLRFSFVPNPKFSPSNRETQVFKGMRGLLWIEPTYERIAAVQGELFKDVNFGWGVLGRLYKGGTFEVVQTQILPGVWRITTLNLDFKGRAFLFSGLRILRKEKSSRFVPTSSGMTVRAALTELLSQTAPGLQAGK